MMFNYHVQHLSKKARASAKAKKAAARAAVKLRRAGGAAARVARHQPRTPQGLEAPTEDLAPNEDGPAADEGDEGGDDVEVGAVVPPVGPVLVVSTTSGRQIMCRLHRRGGKLAAELNIAGGGRWLAVVDLHQLRQDVVASLADRPGWGWGDIKKAAGKLAKQAGVKKLAGAVYSAATSGPVQAGLKLVAPQLGLSSAALKKVGSLYESARKGSKPALQAVKAIRTAAETGNPTAVKAAAALVYLRVDERARGALDLSPSGGGVYGGQYGNTIDKMNHGYQLGLGLLARQYAGAA